MAPKRANEASEEEQAQKRIRTESGLQPPSMDIVISPNPLQAVQMSEEEQITVQIGRNKIVPELQVDLKSFQQSETRYIIKFCWLTENYGLSALLSGLPKGYYPRLVHQFYQTLTVTQNANGEQALIFTIDGERFQLTEEGMRLCSGMDSHRPEDSILKTSRRYSAHHIVEALIGIKDSKIGRGNLLPYLQLFSLLLTQNLYPSGHHYEARGTLLEVLYKIDQEEWINWNEILMEHFIKFYENVRTKKNLKSAGADLKFPRLITAILAHVGFRAAVTEEKVLVESVYTLENWEKKAKIVQTKRQSAMPVQKGVVIQTPTVQQVREEARPVQTQRKKRTEMKRGKKKAQEQTPQSDSEDDVPIATRLGQTSAAILEITPKKKTRTSRRIQSNVVSTPMIEIENSPEKAPVEPENSQVRTERIERAEEIEEVQILSIPDRLPTTGREDSPDKAPEVPEHSQVRTEETEEIEIQSPAESNTARLEKLISQMPDWAQQQSRPQTPISKTPRQTSPAPAQSTVQVDLAPYFDALNKSLSKKIETEIKGVQHQLLQSVQDSQVSSSQSLAWDKKSVQNLLGHTTEELKDFIRGGLEHYKGEIERNLGNLIIDQTNRLDTNIAEIQKEVNEKIGAQSVLIQQIDAQSVQIQQTQTVAGKSMMKRLERMKRRQSRQTLNIKSIKMNLKKTVNESDLDKRLLQMERRLIRVIKDQKKGPVQTSTTKVESSGNQSSDSEEEDSTDDNDTGN